MEIQILIRDTAVGFQLMSHSCVHLPLDLVFWREVLIRAVGMVGAKKFKIKKEEQGGKKGGKNPLIHHRLLFAVVLSYSFIGPHLIGLRSANVSHVSLGEEVSSLVSGINHRRPGTSSPSHIGNTRRAYSKNSYEAGRTGKEARLRQLASYCYLLKEHYMKERCWTIKICPPLLQY